jgi:RHS repeat-associated protein
LKRYGDADYTYTASGDLKEIAVGSEVKVFDYFATGSLRHVKLPGGTTIDYLVDGEGRRVGKKVNGVLTQGLLYQDELKPAAELDGQGNVVSRFVYAGRPNVPDYMVKGGITYRIVSDHLGSVQMVVNSATGEIAQQIDYDEWGNILLDTNPGFQPFGYAGGMYDRDTGLVRFGARDYDPVTGRWTAMDPLGFAGGDSNLYAYVGGNPLSYTDPLGLWRLPDYGAIGVPIIGPVGVSITVDRHGNVYGGIGIGASIRGGAGLGVGWTGDKCTPNSKQTQNFLGGWGYNAGVGIGVTSSGSGVPGSGPSESFGWNVQTPGVGVGYNWNLGNLGNFFK